MNMVALIKSVVAITIAGALAKFGNENYELLKAEGSILVPVVCLLGALGLGIYGIKSFAGAFSRG